MGNDAIFCEYREFLLNNRITRFPNETRLNRARKNAPSSSPETDVQSANLTCLARTFACPCFVFPVSFSDIVTDRIWIDRLRVSFSDTDHFGSVSDFGPYFLAVFFIFRQFSLPRLTTCAS